jgi:hypothetical protein
VNVDGHDFLLWQRGVDGDFDAADLEDWKAAFGTALPSAAGAAGVVPEPATLGLLAAGAGGLAVLRRVRQRAR